MSSHRFAGHRKWQRALFSAGLGALLVPFFGAAVSEAAPRKVRPARGKPGSNAAAIPPQQATPAHPEFADAFPSSAPAAPDLLLTDDDRRKADALSAFAVAVVAEDNAETEKALTNYRKTLEADPSYAELAVKVAYELARRNDVSGGIQVLKDAIKAAPKEPLPLIYLSQLYSKHLKKPDIALRYADQALTLDPENFTSYLALYELHLSTGEAKKAEQILERAAKVNSTDPKFWIQLGDLYTRIFLKEDGTAEPANLEKMTAVYRKAAELGRGDPAILAKVGDYFALSQQVKDAIPLYEAALGGGRPSDGQLSINVREKLARAFLINEQRDQAIAVLEQITKENPTRVETFEFLGELYQQAGEVDKAITNYEHTLSLDGSQPQSYLRLVQMLLHAKKYDKAVETMRTARTKFPDVPQMIPGLAMTLSHAKRHTEAMTAFAEAKAGAEQNHEELNADFYFQYGAAAEQAGLPEKAAELLKQSISLDPANAQAYNYLGYMWVDLGQNLDEAGEMIKKALERDPDNGAFLDSLGWFYYKKGDHERALKELLRAAENIKEEDAVVFDHIGDTYHKLGRMTEALTYWKKALALEKENEPNAKKIAEKIDGSQERVTATQIAAPAAAAGSN
jgi:tetratricopeptide (TPR) repeat protein